MKKLSDHPTAGLIGLCWMNAGTRNVYNSKKPIRAIEDLKGLKIRMMGNPLFVDTMNALGGNGVAMGFDQLINGMQTGVVDGAENNAPSYETGQHYRYAKYYLDDRASDDPGNAGVLEAHLGNAVEGGSGADHERSRRRRSRSSASSGTRWKNSRSTQMKEAGIEIITIADKKPFQDAVKPVWDKYAGKLTRADQAHPGCEVAVCCDQAEARGARNPLPLRERVASNASRVRGAASSDLPFTPHPVPLPQGGGNAGAERCAAWRIARFGRGTFMKSPTSARWMPCIAPASSSRALAIVVITLIIPWGVFTRYVLNSASSWPEPMAILLMIVLSFLSAVVCYREHLHIGVGIAAELADGDCRRSCSASAIEICMLATNLFMLWYGIKLVQATWYQSIAEFPVVSVGVSYLPVPIGGFITVLFVIERLWTQDFFHEPTDRRRPPSDRYRVARAPWTFFS